MNIESPNLTVVAAPTAAPVVSVLMTCYNTERYLREAVESILSQTFADLEFIAVDDGSTDGSLKILQAYAAKDKRVRILTGPNVGIVQAAIKGVAAARGEFLARLDSDDIALPTRLEKQVAYFRAHPECVALGSRALIVDPDGEEICQWGTLTEHEEIDGENMTNGGPALIHCAAMMRRSAMLEVGGYNPAYDVCEDLDLFLRLAEHGRVANLPEPLTKWRQHPNSCCHTRRSEIVEKFTLVLGDAYRRRGIDDPNVPTKEIHGPTSETDHHVQWSWWALREGRISTARKHAYAALRRRPFSKQIWRAVACSVRGY